MLNQLWSNILWGQRSNFVGVPTDCPQRDERLGWTGDAQVFWRAAVFNMDIDAFSRKFAGDLRGTQTAETAMYAHFAPGVFSENDGFAAGWADAGVIIPWTAWVQFGDKRILEQNWHAMQSTWVRLRLLILTISGKTSLALLTAIGFHLKVSRRKTCSPPPIGHMTPR
jgi:alpha-L-rhamnosidase